MWWDHASHGRKKLDIQNVYRSHKDNLFNAYHCIGSVCPSIKEKKQRILENSFSSLWYIVAYLYFLPFPLSKGIIAFVPSSHSFNYSTPVKIDSHCNIIWFYNIWITHFFNNQICFNTTPDESGDAGGLLFGIPLAQPQKVEACPDLCRLCHFISSHFTAIIRL